MFTSLAHHLTEEFLTECFLKLRKSASPGIDGQDWNDYYFLMAPNIEDLHRRLKSGKYKAPGIKRVWIDKSGSEGKRPLGISTIEDKIVQRAVTDILNLIYEKDFYDFSYGFRPKRSAHKALMHAQGVCMSRDISYILDADIKACFDSFDHVVIRKLLRKRVADRAVLKLIDGWLGAKVVDGEAMFSNAEGSPQGNIISPLLCNIYLHYVLDEWLRKVANPLLIGRVELIRYADDFVIGFQFRNDAVRVLNTLGKRMAKFGLTIHPDKTHLVEFIPWNRGKPPVFVFLGFTHYWGKTIKGSWVVKRKTSKDKLRAVVQKIETSCRDNRHLRLKYQFRKLRDILNGEYAYYGIRCNQKAIKRFYRTARQRWFFWLNRRSQRNSYTWEGYKKLLTHFVLPTPRIVHKNV